MQIEGLDACPALEELWVAEAALAHISGLDSCMRLRRLFLHSNHITRIEGLDALTVLEVHVLSALFWHLCRTVTCTAVSRAISHLLCLAPG